MDLEKLFAQQDHLVAELNRLTGDAKAIYSLREELNSQIGDSIKATPISTLNKMIKSEKLEYHPALNGYQVLYIEAEDLYPSLRLVKTAEEIKKEIEEGKAEPVPYVHQGYIAEIQRGKNSEVYIGLVGEIVNGEKKFYRENTGDEKEDAPLSRGNRKYINKPLKSLILLAKAGEWEIN